MDIEKRLKTFKKNYQETIPSQDFLKSGWQDMQNKISQLEQSRIKKSYFYLRPFAFAVFIFFVMVVILGGVVKASQDTLPGDTLYPVKRISENISSKISGNYERKIENRAEEIITLSKKGRDLKEVEKAIEEYKTAVSEASSSGKNTEDFKEKIEEQEKEINKVIEDSKSEDSNESGKDDNSGSSGSGSKSGSGKDRD